MWNQIIFLSVVASIGVISASICAPALPSIAEYFVADLSTVQFAISLFLAGNAIGQMVSGPLSDFFGKRSVMLSGLVVFVLASLLCSFADSMGMLLLGRFFQGMGTAAGPVLARAIATSQFSAHKSAEVMSYGAFGVGLASMLAIIFSGQITMVSWRGNFILAASLGLLLIFWAIPSLKSVNTPSAERRSFKSILSFLKDTLRSPVFLVNTIAHSITYGLMYGYITIFPFIIKDLYHENNPKLVGILSACMIGVYLIGVFGAAKIVARVGLRKLVKGAVALQLVSGVLLTLSQGSVSFFTALILFNLSIGVILPMTSAAALAPLAKTAAGTASSTLGLTYRLIGSLLTSAICLLPVGLGGFLGGSIALLSLFSLLAFKLLESSPQEVLINN
ncbi:MFS transporter [Estrella lausannensis]|uniref:Major facilitator family transporter n=1 Tax=Estrella lausannensis TaxID=483423 RepID=A0A0H5E4V5_9BACT|nr:MFS transporter [Estrella lausannensis]CRX38275.1 Major facilitator family transporter [Estrella lausannensis]